jgi:hypothetical protein
LIPSDLDKKCSWLTQLTQKSLPILRKGGRRTMTARALLRDRQAKDVQLTVQGESLAYDAPDGALTAELLEALRQHKAALLALLVQTPEETPDLEAEYRRFRHCLALWEERAAIMEYDGGLPRDEAEWQAYLCGKGGQHVSE